MKNWKIPLCLGTILLAIALTTAIPGQTLREVAAAGNTYYVDQNHPLASDSNPGTETEPWKTITRAAEIAAAGDTVLVNAGVYPERINPANSGAPGSELTFRAEPRRSVTMYGFDTIGANYLRIEGFNIVTHPSLTGWTEKYGIFIRSDHVVVVDNYLSDIRATAIQGYWHDPFPQAAYIANNRVYKSQMGLGITGADWLVEFNEVERLYNYGSGDSDYARFFGDNHIIRGNTFHGMHLDEIGSAHVDCFQTFDNNGESSHNVIIEGNWCQDFHQGFMGEAHYYRDISHITFKNNIFVHGWAWGLAIEDISYVSVLNNTFVDIQYHGVGLSGPGAHHATIKNNIFYDTGTSYWFPENSASIGNYNLVYQSNDPPVLGANDILGADPEFVNLSGDDFRLRGGSPAVDSGAILPQVTQDYLGAYRPYGTEWDIGAFELHPDLVLAGSPGDHSIYLQWQLNISMPLTATWALRYEGPPGHPASPITGIPPSTRKFYLTGLTNYALYTVTLSGVMDSTPFLTDTVVIFPTDKAVLLPLLP